MEYFDLWDSCMIKSIKLPKSGNQLRFLIHRVPPGCTSNALSIPRKFSALMFSSLIASVWALRICDGNLGCRVITNALTQSGLICSFWLKAFATTFAFPGCKRQNHHFLMVMLRLELHTNSVLVVGKLILGFLPRYTSCFSRERERESQGLDDEGKVLDDEGRGLDDEGPSMKEEEEEEATPEGQQQAVSVVDTTASEPLGLRCGVARRRALESTEEITPTTYEVDPGDGKVYTNILTYAPPAAPVETPPSPEWSFGSLPVSPSSPIRYRFRSLEREQERATMRFSAIWRLILALEAWASQTDAQRAAMWHARYDIQKENYDLRRRLAEERHERVELTDRVARMKRRQEFEGE
uniref:Uncharacterized protein n=1 Tax=Tanacetum cinerariifolium TaxID=118510 RepID=A0A6L2KHY7_TANCI|nr:hypothetical protein [Tanacetum cinerariifolium]